jgi:polysaccharide pyruvyl transferase WcaK-like protein
VNIGDIAHSPGALRAFEQFAPDAELALWPVSLEDREREMFSRHLPKVTLVQGVLGEDGRPSTGELAEAIEWADVLVHGSGPHAVRARDVDAWRRKTRKPYGFFGITVDPVSPPTELPLDDLETMIRALPSFHLDDFQRALFDGADFLYCRDSLSLEYLRRQGVRTPVLEFGPDATFAFDIRDDEVADELLAAHHLESGQFLVLVPGTRWTPYYQLRNRKPDHEALRREAVNAAHAARDRAVLREIAASWVRDTGLPVLVVPEMTYEVELARQYFADMPADVADRVRLLPHYWGPSQAAALYAHARAIVSVECHTPIMGINAGVPAIYLRQPTDTVKGRMYADVGLPQAVVEMTPDAAPAVVAAARDLHHRHDDAVARTLAARSRALDLLREMVVTTLAAAGR